MRPKFKVGLATTTMGDKCEIVTTSASGEFPIVGRRYDQYVDWRADGDPRFKAVGTLQSNVEPEVITFECEWANLGGVIAPICDSSAEFWTQLNKLVGKHTRVTVEVLDE